MIRLFVTLLCIVMLGCAGTPEPTKTPEPVPSYSNDIMAYHPKLYSQAYNRFYNAATQGDPIAQNNLGRMYADGRGVERNSETAAKWFLASAKQGNVDAEMNLGVAYLYGQGVQKDPEQACSWFEKAKKAGSAPGHEMYHNYCV